MNFALAPHLFDLTHCVIYAVVFLLLSAFVWVYFRWRQSGLYGDDSEEDIVQRKRLALILKSGRMRLWYYLVSSHHYFFLSEDGGSYAEYNPVDFMQLFGFDNTEALRRHIFEIIEGKRQSVELMLHGNATSEEDVRCYKINISVTQVDKHGRPSLLMGVQHDCTEELRLQQQTEQLVMRYHTVFNSSLLDMIYYDKDGVLRDINERACAAFNIKDREAAINEHFLLQNNPMFANIPLDQLEDTRTTARVDFADYNDPVYKRDELQLSGVMYYESAINPIRNEDGELEGIYMAGRNISEMVESFHKQQASLRQLQQATKEIEGYINDINYALRISDVRLVNYYPQSYTFEISNIVNQSQLCMSQLRCIRLATLPFRRTVSSILNRMDHRTQHSIVQTIETEIRDKQRRQIWLQFSLVPIIDKQGNVERYFGMCRNVTDQVETERRLAVETKKAQETELLKQAFLTNMSYEIRTPLNTVVGFAELFNADHDEADEPFFVEQIKTSTSNLLSLVNDILFLSRLDAHMEEYHIEDVDFAQIFESQCQLGLTSANPEVKVLIERPYNQLVVDIDAQNLGKVVQRLCYISTMMTSTGTITASYEYRRGELTVSVEDTGIGIHHEVLPHVFDRFCRDENGQMCGTGLDLPIVQSLVQQMGGNVDIQSEKGKGTTVWVSIPCTAKMVEKKREVIAS